MGPQQVDLFGSRLTCHLQRVYSQRPDPIAVASDAFLQNWGPLKERVCKPCMESDRLSPVPNTRTNHTPSTSSTSLEGSDLISNFVRDADQLSPSDYLTGKLVIEVHQ